MQNDKHNSNGLLRYKAGVFMKKARGKICRQEIIYDFIIYGLTVFCGGGFLLYHIMKVADKTVIHAEDIRLIGFSVAVFFAIIILSGIYLYRISASYIRWYKGILDSIPMPVIVTDENARWQQINNATREIMNLELNSELSELNSRHLIDTGNSVMKKFLTHNGQEYRVIGNRLLYDGKDAGYLIMLSNIHNPESTEARIGSINEINRLLGRLGAATDLFHDCASTLAGCTAQQAGFINELSDVIMGIASGEFKEVDTLNKKINVVKVDMQQHVESSQAYLEALKQTVKELDSARNYVDSVIHNMDP